MTCSSMESINTSFTERKKSKIPSGAKTLEYKSGELHSMLFTISWFVRQKVKFFAHSPSCQLNAKGFTVVVQETVPYPLMI